jgi:Zn finger protein HypA/HybF involved in hydrogenase expression
MHELSIAMNILDLAREEAEMRGSAGVDVVYLRLGTLSGVAEEALFFPSKTQSCSSKRFLSW